MSPIPLNQLDSDQFVMIQCVTAGKWHLCVLRVWSNVAQGISRKTGREGTGQPAALSPGRWQTRKVQRGERERGWVTGQQCSLCPNTWLLAQLGGTQGGRKLECFLGVEPRSKVQSWFALRIGARPTHTGGASVQQVCRTGLQSLWELTHSLLGPLTLPPPALTLSLTSCSICCSGGLKVSHGECYRLSLVTG